MLSFNDILHIGFVDVGYFFLNGADLDFNLNSVSKENGCYFFSIGKNVYYIGITGNGIRHRMRQYRKPGPRQKTNQHVKDQMMRVLPKYKKVSIYFLHDNQIDNFTVNLVEKKLTVECDMKLIERLLINGLHPKWNRS